MNPYTLLREILGKDEEAVANLKEMLGAQYEKAPEMVDLHARVQQCLEGEGKEFVLLPTTLFREIAGLLRSNREVLSAVQQAQARLLGEMAGYGSLGSLYEIRNNPE